MFDDFCYVSQPWILSLSLSHMGSALWHMYLVCRVQSQEYIWNHRAAIESTRGIKHEKPTSQLEPILPHFVAGNFPVFCLNPMLLLLLLLLLLSSLLLIKWFRCNHHRTNVESAQFWWDNVCCVSLSCQLIHWEGNSHPSSFVELFPLVC